MPQLLKPKIVEDITPRSKARRRSSFSPLPQRINLSYRKTWRLPFLEMAKVSIIGATLLMFILGSTLAPTSPTQAANSSNDTERAQLESQLKELETQIDQYQAQIKSYQKQGNTLKSQITQLNDKIAKINLQIKAINLTLIQLDKKIQDTQQQINVTENDIATHEEALASLVRELYQNERISLIEIFLKNPKLSDFFGNLTNVELLQNNVRITISQIRDLQGELKDQRDQYALARSDAETVRAYQISEKSQTDELKAQKNNLLAVTKGQESKYQDLLKKTKETAAQIRSRIFQLLGGGQLTFEQAYQFAKLASQATGVRAAFILAVLDRESALGQNVGRCDYKTAMSPDNQPIFLNILTKLNLSPASVQVSCPNADGIYGGAMGPAQFLPTTWMLYADQVAKITGHNPPSPWNNADAFVAAALYLRDAGAVENERMAAAKYYCGSRWNRYVCTNVYGRAVVERTDQFQEDITTITQN